MKPSKIYTIFFFVVVSLGLFLFWPKPHGAKQVFTQNAATQVKADRKPVETPPPNPETSSEPNFAQISAEQSEWLAKNAGITSGISKEAALKKMAEWYQTQAANMVAQDQHPIIFYGQTVDENNQPVAGVNIHFSLSNPPNPGPNGVFEKNAQSDINGYFSISDAVGSVLQVWLDKSGYYVSKSNQISFDYTSYRPNPLQPQIFHLRKKGDGADIISAMINVQLPRDGTPVSVDFYNKSFGATGQMTISQSKPPYESWKKATNWAFGITLIDGGLVEEYQEFPFEAPANGYQPAIKYDFKSNQPDWKTRLIKNYYFTFGSPPCYGQMTVETDIMWGNARISYAINPSGSRNLEPK